VAAVAGEMDDAFGAVLLPHARVAQEIHEGFRDGCYLDDLELGGRERLLHALQGRAQRTPGVLGRPTAAQVLPGDFLLADDLGLGAFEFLGGQAVRAQFFGFLPPHGLVLADGAEVVLEGDLRTIIASGPNKAAVNFGPLSDEARDKIARDVSFANDQFVKAVARGRGVSQKAVNENMGGGDVFNPPDLLKRNMADRIAPIKDTLARFGVEISPAKKAAAGAARSALALGYVPAVSDFEALLREHGAPKSLAARLASGGAADRSRSESGDDPPSRSESGGETGIQESLDALRAMRSAFKKSFDD